MAVNEFTLGVDLSSWESDRVDWTKAIAAGVRFTNARATIGLRKDDKYDQHHQSAKGLLPRHSYSFYWPWANPKRQAEFYWETIKDDPGELPAVIDIELENKAAKAANYFGWRNWYDWLERWNEITDHPIMIYTRAYFWKDHGPNWPTEREYFHKYPLWIANYRVQKPMVPSPWQPEEWRVWQYDENIIIPGINDAGRPTSVDTNWFHGTETELNAWAESIGDVPPPPDDETPIPEPTPEPTPESGDDNMTTRYDCEVIYSGGARVRPGPTTNNDGLRVMAQGTEFVGVEIVPDADDLNNADKKWMRTEHNEYVAVYYPNNAGDPRQRCTYTAVPVIPDFDPEEEEGDLLVEITLGDDVVYEKRSVKFYLKKV